MEPRIFKTGLLLVIIGFFTTQLFGQNNLNKANKTLYPECSQRARITKKFRTKNRIQKSILLKGNDLKLNKIYEIDAGILLSFFFSIPDFEVYEKLTKMVWFKVPEPYRKRIEIESTRLRQVVSVYKDQYSLHL